MRISWTVLALSTVCGCTSPYYAALLGGLNVGVPQPMNQPQRNNYQAQQQAQQQPQQQPQQSMNAPQGAPPPVSTMAPMAPRTPPRWRGTTAVRLVNRSAVAVCYAQMVPENESDMSGDWLGASEVVAPGQSHEFRVRPGKYRVHFETCEHDVVLDEASLDFRGPRELAVLSQGATGMGSSNDRIEVHTTAQPRSHY